MTGKELVDYSKCSTTDFKNFDSNSREHPHRWRKQVPWRCPPTLRHWM